MLPAAAFFFFNTNFAFGANENEAEASEVRKEEIKKEEVKKEEEEEEEAPIDPLYPMNGMYYGIGAQRNYPVGRSQEFFATGKVHPAVVYRFFRNDWLLGVEAAFKSFSNEFEGGKGERYDQAPILSLNQSFEYLFRLYHPLYILFGYKLMYLYPVEKVDFPAKKNQDFETEVGAGITSTLVWRASEDYLGMLSLSRWRGTATTKLQGYDWQLVLAKKL